MNKKDESNPHLEAMAALQNAKPFLQLTYGDEVVQKIEALAQTPDYMFKTPQTWLAQLTALIQNPNLDMENAGVAELLQVLTQFRECQHIVRQSGQKTRQELMTSSIAGQELSRFFSYVDEKLGSDVVHQIVAPACELQVAFIIEAGSDELMQEDAAFETRVAALFRQHVRFAEKAYKPMLSAILKLTWAALGVSNDKTVPKMLGPIMKACRDLWDRHPGPWPKSILNQLALALRNAEAHREYRIDVEHEWVILDTKPNEPLTHDRFSEAVAEFSQLCATMLHYFSPTGIGQP